LALSANRLWPQRESPNIAINAVLNQVFFIYRYLLETYYVPVTLPLIIGNVTGFVKKYFLFFFWFLDAQ
jgi:hypothetical protein